MPEKAIDEGLRYFQATRRRVSEDPHAPEPQEREWIGGVIESAAPAIRVQEHQRLLNAQPLEGAARVISEAFDFAEMGGDVDTQAVARSVVEAATVNAGNDDPETYIPVSVLLSDEVVERQMERIYERDPNPNKPLYPECPAYRKSSLRSVAIEDLQAAIEQVGGGQGG